MCQKNFLTFIILKTFILTFSLATFASSSNIFEQQEKKRQERIYTPSTAHTNQDHAFTPSISPIPHEIPDSNHLADTTDPAIPPDRSSLERKHSPCSNRKISYPLNQYDFQDIIDITQLCHVAHFSHLDEDQFLILSGHSLGGGCH